ncbi:hypothetical protein [Sciscionella marina]|uniref:hypothetical protein n=1 Tax=Sciscionella marina TaxID=508770 RepID=UPI000363B832
MTAETPQGRNEEDEMIIDCERCPVRGKACEDCVVSVLFGGPPAAEPETPFGAGLDAEHRRAIEVLAEAGMVSKVRALPLTVIDESGHRQRAG